ncbi:MAG TPA: hypothetical protein VFH33_08075, partial [Candidatus Krumholzibacteria bacterium]|nr:hypothetical protein [Candidatus Krumholzibacteria bacterium]
TSLYRETARVAGPGAEYAIFAESEWFGFQFYAGSDMKRLSRSGLETWSDGRVADALASRNNRTLAIVTSSRAAPELEQALRRAQVVFARQRAAGRDVFVIGAASVSSPTGPLSVRQ